MINGLGSMLKKTKCNPYMKMISRSVHLISLVTHKSSIGVVFKVNLTWYFLDQMDFQVCSYCY